MKKRILNTLLSILIVAALLPITAFAATVTNITVTSPEYYASGAVKSVTAKFNWGVNPPRGRLVLMTKRLNGGGYNGTGYGDFSDLGNYGSSFTSFSAVLTRDQTSNTFGIISYTEEKSISYSGNQIKFNFNETDIPLSKNATYYVYFWTYYSGNYYPDNLILAFEVKNGGLKYTVADSNAGRNVLSNSSTTVVAEAKYNVSINAAAGMTKTGDSGAASQTNLDQAMTPVVYTANTGYEFPANYSVATTNGIMVRRDSDTQITVYGTPTGNTTITLPAPASIAADVASVTFDGTTTGYPTIDAAWAAATACDTTANKKATIKLLGDCTSTDTLTNNGDYIILDTNGKTLTCNHTTYYASGILNDSGSLEITGNGKITASTYRSTAHGVLENGSAGTLTVDGAWIYNSGTNTSFPVVNNGSFHFYSGTLQSSSSKNEDLRALVASGDTAYLYSGTLISNADDEAAILVSTSYPYGNLEIGYSANPLTIISNYHPSIFGSQASLNRVKVSDDIVIDITYGPNADGTGTTTITNQTEISETVNASQYMKITAKLKKVITASAAAGGTVTGTGKYAPGASVTLTATPDSGYNFANWTENGTVVSTDAAYTFIANDDRTLIANFVEKDTVSIDETPQTYTYDGSAKTFAVNGTPNSGFDVQYYVNNGWTGTAPSTAGSYDVKLSRAEDGTYKAFAKTIANGLVISKADSAVTAAPTSKTGLVYHGAAQDLIEAGSATGGEMQYSLDGVTYSAAIPTAANAAEYTVYYKVVGDVNHNDAEGGSVAVTIGAKTLTITADAKSKTYGEADPELTYTVTGLVSSDAQDSVLSGALTRAAGEDVDTYAITQGSLAANANYSISFTGANLTVQQKEVELSWSEPTPAELIYSGTAKTLTATATNLKSGDSCDVTVEPVGNNVNVGSFSYTATALSNSNYKLPSNADSPSYTITAKSVTASVEVSGSPFVYNGSEHKPDVTVKDGETTIPASEYTVSYTDNTNAGTATVTITDKDGGNYTVTGGTSFEIDKKACSALSVVEREFMRTIAATGNEIDVEAMLPSDYGTAAYTVTSSGYAALENVAVNATGKLVFDTKIYDTAVTDTITVKVEMQNYTDAVLTVKVTLNEKTPLEITGVSAVTGLIYNRGAHQGYTGTPTSTSYSGNYEITYTGRGNDYNSEAAPVNAGDYTVTFQIPDSDLYYSGSASVNFSIGKAPVTVTADNKSTYVEHTMPELTYVVEGLIGSDSISITLSCNADMNLAGDTPIVVTATDPNGNYEITAVNGTLTVSDYPAYRINTQADGHGIAKTDYRYARTGRKVTITATPDDGFVTKSITVITATGRSIAVTDKGDGIYTFTMPSYAVTVNVVFGMPFEDVIQGDTFHDDIEWIYANRYMIGKTEDFFDEKGNVTRQQICMVLARINNVWPEHMADAFAWGVENGIINNSRPGGAATRQEMVTMLWKACGKPDADTSALDAFSDVSVLSGEAQTAMAWAAEVGIVVGYDDGTVRPAANITRGAFAGILYRYLAK